MQKMRQELRQVGRAVNCMPRWHAVCDIRIEIADFNANPAIAIELDRSLDKIDRKACSMLMKRMIRTAFLATVATIGIGLMSSDASAQCYNGGYRGRGISISFGSGYGSGFGFSYRPQRRYRSYRSGWYHDTSHVDYYPGRHVRHGDHYHYLPGHYGIHRTGHWHH